MRRRFLASAAVLFFFGMSLWLGCGDDNPARPVSPEAGEISSDSGGPSGDAGDGGAHDAAPTAVTCAAYCAEVKQNCTGAVQPAGNADAATSQYETNEGCLHACSAMPLGTRGETSGDTVGCRLYHAGAPAAALPVTHCPHAGIVGAGICSGPAASAHGGRCGTFCKLATALCTFGPGKPFENEADCLSKCASYTFDPSQNELTTAGDTLNCRQYHLAAAYRDPALPDGGFTASSVTHCPHLAPGPDAGPCH